MKKLTKIGFVAVAVLSLVFLNPKTTSAFEIKLPEGASNEEIKVILMALISSLQEQLNELKAKEANTSYKYDFKEVDRHDHILGDRSADIKIVTYSDYECPFCKSFYPTIERVIEYYGDDVAWVYRHYPLTQIHPAAGYAAKISECVADVEGEDAFWDFTKEVFSNEGSLSEESILEAVDNTGALESSIDRCMKKTTAEDRVIADMESVSDVVEAGGFGTPYSILVIDGKPIREINGAQPYQVVRSIIENNK